ncbi:MAG: RDD family protein [Carnobacterium alterfunditum]
MNTTPKNNEQENTEETVQIKKGDTKELDLSELKKVLASEEAEIERVKRFKKQEEKNETNLSDNAAIKTSLEETKTQEKQSNSPQELRNARRKYWQEKQKEEERQRKPFHNFPAFFYAGFWLRLFAFLIDLLVIWSINRLIVQSLFLVLRYPLSEESFSAFSLSKLAVYLLYFIVSTKWTNGQTIGKIIFGIRVVSFKEEKLSWGTVLIRECFGRYILKIFPFIYLMVLFTREKQHLADFFSDTAVISENLVRASELSLKEQ